jgi:hypothetical protein
MRRSVAASTYSDVDHHRDIEGDDVFDFARHIHHEHVNHGKALPRDMDKQLGPTWSRRSERRRLPQ